MQGLLNCLMMEILYCSLYGVIFTFPEEVPIFVQECADRSYSPLAYYSSKLIVMVNMRIENAFDFHDIDEEFCMHIYLYGICFSVCKIGGRSVRLYELCIRCNRLEQDFNGLSSVR